MTGFKHIEVIDLDTIDISNLNRQFLFREKDVGKFKSDVAAEFIRKRVSNCNIISHHCKIQDFGQEFYYRFDAVIGCLDNVEGRLWINDMLVHIAKSFGKIIPYFDGGSERWMGHIKVIVPTVTACLSCHPEFFVELNEFQLCTIANNPRQPEHCIAYAMEKLWPETFPNLKFNPEDEENIKWIHEKSQEIAQKNNIVGITYRFVKGIVKNIVPAIASTQSFVASMCVTELLKYLTENGDNLRNILISGEEGIYGVDLEYAKMPECHACGSIVIKIQLKEDETVSEFIQRLEKEYNLKNARLVINTDDDRIIPIYSPKIYKESQANLCKQMKNFVESGSEIIGITPDNLDSTYIIRII